MRERTVEGPWSIMAADIMRPFPPSRSQKKYLSVLQDYFTKYVEMRALTKADAKSVWKVLDETVINRWGKPKYFLTDHGTEFVEKGLEAKLAECGINTLRHLHTILKPIRWSALTEPFDQCWKYTCETAIGIGIYIWMKWLSPLILRYSHPQESLQPSWIWDVTLCPSIACERRSNLRKI